MNIEIQNLKKYFEKTRAVDDVSFSFTSGQIIGFVGPNGAGKTTTMRIMATMEEPTGGDVLVNGVSVVEEPEKARQLVGYVPDSLFGHTDIAVHEYLDFFARAYGLKGQHRRQVVESVQEFTNLLGIREKMIDSLSKGMKQRVTLARALLHDPMVLIMDEPAAGLDPRARIELRELVKVLSQQGKAILISSHILTELAEMCTGAVIIERGRILMAGRIEELMNQTSAHRDVLIRPHTRQEDLYRDLLEMPFVEDVRLVGNEVAVKVQGTDETTCDLLAQIIQRGHRILEFKQQRANLEEIFMSVTKGEVQ